MRGVTSHSETHSTTERRLSRVKNLHAMDFHIIICPIFISMNFLCVLLGQFQNSTLEERVELLEGQVVVIQDEVSDIETDVDFLFDEQAIQDERLLNHDERLFSLEQISIDVDAQLDVIDDTLEGNKVRSFPK